MESDESQVSSDIDYPDSVVVAALQEDGGIPLDSYFLFGACEFEGMSIGCWDPNDGRIIVIISDDARELATKRFLLRTGVPVYRNQNELLADAFKMRRGGIIRGIAECQWEEDIYAVRVYPACANDDTLKRLTQDLRFAPRIRLDLSNGVFSDKVFVNLTTLSQLEELILSNVVVGRDAIKEVNACLPNCRITE